jgi:hypothetical protein
VKHARKRAKKKGNGRTPVLPLDEPAPVRTLANGRFTSIVRHAAAQARQNQSAYEYGEADVERIRVKLQAELERP